MTDKIKRGDHRISVKYETFASLETYRDRLKDQLGFRPTHSQAIDHLLKRDHDAR